MIAGKKIAETGTDQLKIAKEVYDNGGVLIYPTEAVFGIGCNPFNQNAVKKIYEIKKRSPSKPLIIIGSQISQFKKLIKLSLLNQDKTLKYNWPGHFTYIFPAKTSAPDWLKAHDGTIALRLSAMPFITKLCNYCKGPLISTSANNSGHTPFRDYHSVYTFFSEKVDLIINEQCGGMKNTSTLLQYSSDA